jgi:ADP-ribosyl-[dinitrogen reductase] hydrolase
MLPGWFLHRRMNALTHIRLDALTHCGTDGKTKVNEVDNVPLDPLDDIASGSFKEKDPPDIRGTGYVVQSLEAALWAFYHGNSFKEGCLLAVNLGDDADTTGAVYGQLAGAFYGEKEIPEDWREKISHHELIVSFEEQLLRL